MRMHWANNYDLIGNALGYSSHQKNLKRALEDIGVVMDDNSDIAVSIVTPENYQPLYGKYNVLYTMYECTTIPDNWIAPVNMADLIVVPCKQNKVLFSGYTDIPIEVCWEGVDVEKFTYKKRNFPIDEPFVFLWVGASNPRKGYEHIVMAWKIFREKHPDWPCVLYMKTTQTTREERLVQVGRDAFVDTRLLPLKKEEGANVKPTLINLYHMAHAFLLPSMGEGFGLTLAEAMATGLPCIYTPWSGPVDFISNKEGYPVKYKFITVKTVAVTPEGAERIAHESKAASADIYDIVRQMERIFLEYDQALQKGKLAAERIRRDITWEKSAQSFAAIIEKYTKERL